VELKYSGDAKRLRGKKRKGDMEDHLSKKGAWKEEARYPSYCPNLGKKEIERD